LDKTARVWDVNAGRSLIEFKGHEGAINSAAWCPKGNRIVTASNDMTARVWDAVTGEEIGKFEGHTGTVSSAAWSPEGTRIVTVSREDSARVWEVATGFELARFVHYGNVYGAVWVPSGALILTWSQNKDRAVSVWEISTGARIARFVDDTGSYGPTVAGVSPDGSFIFMAFAYGHGRIWRLEKSAESLVQQSKHRVSFCLNQQERKKFGLSAAPPTWCITGPGLEFEKEPGKWRPKQPYQTLQWRDWLVAHLHGEDKAVPAN
jgi:WD40 repeat protein